MQHRHPGKSTLQRRLTPFNLLIVLFTILFVAFFLAPFYWQIATSLRTPGNLTTMPPQLFPNPMFFARYANVLFHSVFVVNIRNSLIVAFVTTIVCLMFSTFSSYAIARLRIPGGQTILLTVLVISLLPGVSIIAPLYIVYRNLELLNTFPSLFVSYIAFFLPFSMWFLTAFFRTIPRELEEAATMDGAGVMQTMLRIIVPLAAPAVFTVAMLVFISAWNEFLFAYTFTTTNGVRTYPVGLIMFQGLHSIPWGTLSTASTMVAVPIIILVVIAQRYVIQGLTAGSVKG